MNLKQLLYLKGATGGSVEEFFEETGYEHENVTSLTFIGNPYAFSKPHVFLSPNIIKLKDIDHTYNQVLMKTRGNIMTYNGTGNATNDIAIMDTNTEVDLPAGTYNGLFMPYMGNSVLNNGKNMYVDFWYDGSTDRDVRVKVEGVKDQTVLFRVTLTSHANRMRVYAGFGPNTYSDYRLFVYMCKGDIGAYTYGDPIADGESVKVTLENEMPYVYTGQHQTTVKKSVIPFEYKIGAYIASYGNVPYKRTSCETYNNSFACGFVTGQEYKAIQNKTSDGIDKYPIKFGSTSKIRFVVPNNLRVTVFFVDSNVSAGGYAKWIDGDANAYDSNVPVGPREVTVPEGADSFGFSIQYPNSGTITDEIMKSIKIVRV